MKLKKILALACSLALVSSMFVVTANATVAGCTATLEFAGYEVKGTTTFAKVNVKATIPDTLSPYKETLADWSTTFADTYEGQMLQLVGFDIPYVEGLNIITSLTANKAEYVTVTANATDKKVTLSYQGGEDVASYYAGEIGTLATLYYQITGDIDATYNLALTDAVIGIVTVSGDSSVGKTVAPKEYRFDDFAITNAVVKPEEEDEPVTYYGTPVAAKDNIVIGETKYTGVAHVDVVCDWGSQDATGATKFGYLLKDSTNSERVKDIEIGTSISGSGAVEATFIFYNIADASTISATPYFVK